MTVFILRLLVVNMAVEKFKFVCYTYFVTKSRLVQRSSAYEKKCFISYFYCYCNRFTDSSDIYKGLDFLSAHCLSCVCSINNRKQKKKAEINSNPALVPAVTLPGVTAFLLLGVIPVSYTHLGAAGQDCGNGCDGEADKQDSVLVLLPFG